jgi:hypothetical protein
MATTFTALLPIVRNHLVEPVAKFWADDELTKIMFAGARDLWRDTADLKQEHYLTVDVTNVSLPANSSQLSGVPSDVHKVYIIEPRDLSVNGSNHGLLFKPIEYNSNQFQLARSRNAIDPTNDTIYYAITDPGTPVGPPIIRVAPKLTSAVPIAFSYVPSLGTLTAGSILPIPGEADNAIVAWTVAFARAKEREDRSPDSAWLMIYATEKQHLLQSLGLRQYQEPSFSEALFSEYW